jgi:hypothetical protein
MLQGREKNFCDRQASEINGMNEDYHSAIESIVLRT